MCGRFTITLPASILQEELGLGEMPEEWKLRFNVAPTQPIPVVRDEKTRKVEYMYWGLIPSWAKDISIGQKLINARSETLTEKPSFRNAFQRRRCLILADGFYEWRRPAGKTGPAIPFYFRRKDKRPFTFAGLWEYWTSCGGDELFSTTIITCQANALIAEIHPRMPVILPEDDFWDWIKPGTTPQLQQMLVPYDEKMMTAYEVSKMVNSGQCDNADLIKPITG